MNCLYIEKMVNDLARDQIIEAATRERALRHSEGCSECAARLRDERALSAGLRALARSSETSEAPARVEASLMAAFRERRNPACATAEEAAQATARARVAGIGPARVRWALGAAAALLLLFALATTLPKGSSVESTRQVTADVPKEEMKEEPKGDERADPPIGPLEKRHAARPLATRAKPDRKRAVAHPGRVAQAKSVARPNTENPDHVEIATEFIPLVNSDTLQSIEGGQVVRVEMPRSVLVSFGLPMNMDRADERIKADVVMGNDGLARAIRFVR